MAFEDIHCPCGGRKDRETMLCGKCEDALAEDPDMKVFKDQSFSRDARRSAAIHLLAEARKRGRF